MFLEELELMKDYYENSFIPHIDNGLKKTKQEQEVIFDESMASVADEKDFDDSYFIDYYQEFVGKAEFLHYRMIGSAIVAIISLLEQQLREHGVASPTYRGHAIYKYRLLSNAIKHGDGHSFTEIEQSFPELVKTDGFKYSSDFYKFITGYKPKVILNYDQSDIVKCCDEAISFLKITL